MANVLGWCSRPLPLKAKDWKQGVGGVDTGIIANEAAPSGGVKQSGLGREGGRYGIEEFLEVSRVCVAALGG